MLMLLHHCQIFDQPHYKQEMTETIQPLVDDNMALVDLLSDTPLANVTLWSVIVTGTMMQHNHQRLYLAQRLKHHHTQTPVAARAAEVLTRIWRDPERDSCGLYGIAKVARSQMINICLT